MEKCIFCRIAAGEAPCYKIFEDEDTLAFLDVAGDAEGHTVVIPKRHTENLMTSDGETARHVMDTVKLVSEHYVNHCGYEGVNLLNASGKSAQQSVFHLHFHIIPRKAGDGVNAWPALGRDPSDLEQTRRALTIPEK